MPSFDTKTKKATAEKGKTYTHVNVCVSFLLSDCLLRFCFCFVSPVVSGGYTQERGSIPRERKKRELRSTIKYFETLS